MQEKRQDHDLIEREPAEDALRLSEQRYRSLIEASAAIVWTLTASGVADNSEQASWSAFTGQSKDEFAGWGWLNCVHPDDREYTIQTWNSAVSAGVLYQIEYRIRRHDGVYRNMLTRGVPILATNGRIREWFGTCIDITELKQLEEELRQAKMTAEAANRAKDEFLANVSHEIRTPMNAILGMTELVLDTPLTEDQRRCLKTVKSGANSLLSMINDLLDFSKIEADKLQLDPAEFPLRATLGDTLRVLAMRAHKKGLELVSHVHPNVPDVLIGDAGRLRQVLFNLVGNAIKFTEEGEVVVQVEVANKPVSEGDVAVHFVVRDTGIGISLDKQEKIFRAFEQEDTSTTRKYGGTGLGLTIAARLVNLMGGTITVDSKPDRGSTFAFTARFENQPHPQESITSQPLILLQNLKVLVVDDNATNRHILEEWLRGWQMEPVAVGDGLSALNSLWNSAASGRPFALALLDARMPDTDGLSLAALIRERAELSNMCIILLTSGERPGDLTRIRELRIEAHLLKPVQQDELLETIYQVLSRAKGSRPPLLSNAQAQRVGLPTFASAAMTPLNILVAEDNELNAQVLEQFLVRQGHRVQLTSNGRETLTLVAREAFNLLLLDIHMPELDGFQVVRAIREREQTTSGHLPVIALTARSRKEDRERCLAVGMDDFLTKPIRPPELWAAIERVMKNHPRRKLVSLELLDMPLLLAACGDDSSLLRKMCQTLKTRAIQHLATLHDALRDQDAIHLREVAHKFCGLLSEFSTVAGDLAASLEDLAAEARFDEASTLIDKLDILVPELIRQTEGLAVDDLRREGQAGNKPESEAHP